MKSFFVKFLQQKITTFYPEEWELKKLTSKCMTQDDWVKRVFDISNDTSAIYVDIQFENRIEELLTFVKQDRLVAIKTRYSSDVISEVSEVKDAAYYTILSPYYPDTITLVIFKKLADSIMTIVLLHGAGPEEKLLEHGLLLVNNMKLS
jgi:hypothetical protein